MLSGTESPLGHVGQHPPPASAPVRSPEILSTALQLRLRGPTLLEQRIPCRRPRGKQWRSRWRTVRRTHSSGMQRVTTGWPSKQAAEKEPPGAGQGGRGGPHSRAIRPGCGEDSRTFPKLCPDPSADAGSPLAGGSRTTSDQPRAAQCTALTQGQLLGSQAQNSDQASVCSLSSSHRRSTHCSLRSCCSQDHGDEQWTPSLLPR